MSLKDAWNHEVRLSQVGRGPISLDLAATEAQRQAIAKILQLPELKALSAQLRLRPWLDGAELSGALHATVIQESGLSLELFETVIEAPVEARFVPAGSPHAPDPATEIELDPEQPDPPEVLEGETIDVAALVVEHLALALDPFPRKPGETFDYEPPQDDDSPFAVLKRLKDDKR